MPPAKSEENTHQDFTDAKEESDQEQPVESILIQSDDEQPPLRNSSDIKKYCQSQGTRPPTFMERDVMYPGRTWEGSQLRFFSED